MVKKEEWNIHKILVNNVNNVNNGSWCYLAYFLCKLAFNFIQNNYHLSLFIQKKKKVTSQQISLTKNHFIINNTYHIHYVIACVRPLRVCVCMSTTCLRLCVPEYQATLLHIENK